MGRVYRQRYLHTQDQSHDGYNHLRLGQIQ